MVGYFDGDSISVALMHREPRQHIVRAWSRLTNLARIFRWRRKAAIPIWTNANWLPSGRSPWGGHWKDRRWMNTPGPIYTGESDFALFGPHVAPSLVAIDEEHVDVVFRQPCTATELELAIHAADCDPFDGYAADGNEHWTVAEVRAWWQRRDEIRAHIEQHLFSDWYQHASERPMLRHVGRAWLHFLENDAQHYLRQYCFFLDERCWPATNARLPEL